ncbi:HDOD domain-containing protein [Pseudomaricurvus alkylphenolicus]|jgi:HD-like signal output (HDOD) protein|uniref:HDOD domain-containing protein n=1 Tax=Pseudomaricurvus alkylphenolicus TaxID=1306991 RepID=UPI00141E72D6|nr:HDOD domain-containing protein [Pseudomaricurvus alkylphenolicus]NIB41901.1 HDOD domain-containing protein [Pseudomaricurvus alkylphenolicus]
MPVTATPADLSEDGKAIARAVIDQRKSGNLEVPLLPEVASKVIALSQDTESDAVDLAQLIQSDPSLAAHVMRIANSAAYSPNATLVSLQQAITRLGMNLIGDIAVAASINTKMFKAPGYEQRIADTWKHALATGLWAKEIARQCRINVEATFLCGLLHSIGRPVTLQASCDEAEKQQLQLTQDDAITLEELLNLSVGLCVLKAWEMPLIICEALKYFHDYQNAPHAVEQTQVVHAAACFAHHMLDPETTPKDSLLALEVLADLNLYQDEVQDLLDKRDDVYSTMETMSES